MLETPYKGPFAINLCWTNGTVTLQCGPIKIRRNIRRMKPYKSGTKVVYMNTENMCDNFNI